MHKDPYNRQAIFGQLLWLQIHLQDLHLALRIHSATSTHDRLAIQLQS